MKSSLLLLFVVLLSGRPTFAQEEAAPNSVGFLQVVNLVSQKSPTYLSLEGFAFNRGEPIEVGGGSGTLALRPGEFDLILSNEIAKPTSSSLPVKIENGKTVVVLCYDEIREKSDGEKEVRLRFSQLTEAPESDVAKLTVVSLFVGREITISIEGRPFLVAPRAPIQVDIEGKESIAIRSEGRTLIDFETDRPGHYLVFLFRDPDLEELSASYLHNEKLEYTPPLEEEGED